MTLTRQMTFWVLTLLAGVVALYVLREILLPFVAGMALAYLLDPLANRLERLGVNRLVASLVIIGAFVLGFVILLLLFVPVLIGQLGAFIEKLPGYVSRLQTLAMDPNREWLRKIVGEGVADAQIGDIVKQGAGWAAAFLKSLWSGGQALISIFSLVVVTPVVAFYLLYDWNRMVAHGRQLDPAAASRDRARPRARDGRRDRGLRARPDGGVPDPRLVLRGRADARRA